MNKDVRNTGETVGNETNAAELITENLRMTMPEEAWDKWVSHFTYEKITQEEVVVAYGGKEPLGEFNRSYKDLLRVGICSVVGYVKKISIYRKNADETVIYPPREKKKSTFRRFAAFFSAAFVLCAAFAVAAVAVNYAENRNFTETFYTVSSIKVDERVRVLQISDLHSCAYGENNGDLALRAQKLKPDVIILTGDCIDAAADSAEDVAYLCASLAEIAPTYYIYGNNEDERVYGEALTQEALDERYGFAADEERDPGVLLLEDDELQRLIEESGAKVLKNGSDTITVGNLGIDIYGALTSNPSSFWSYAGESFESFLYENPQNLKITALHEPFVFEEYAFDFWGDLLLCGHTHGGMVKVPILGALYTHEGGLFPERSGHFIYGRYDVSGCPLIVSSGLDNESIFRINNPPELVIIDINRF